MEMAGILPEFRIDFQNQECKSEFMLCSAAYYIKRRLKYTLKRDV